MTNLRAVPFTAVLVAGVFGAAAPAWAQSWRLRFDAQARMVAFRGVELDSVPSTDVVAGPTGGPVSPDGIIARCPPTSSYCYLFRRGERRRGGPAVTSADLSMWGLGVSGLRVRVNARAGVDLGSADAWPGLSPAVQLLEGFAEYSGERVTARLGRQTLSSRLGWSNFDGARLIGRVPRYGLDGEIYGGLGLARATALAVTSPALNPLDEFIPRERQLVVGAAAGWHGRGIDLRLDYQREVDRETDHFWSERIAGAAAWRIRPGWSAAAGAEYDLSNSWFGTWDLDLRYASRRLSATTGVRQYRPWFPLWTIWGAFSPVPYRAAHGSIQVSPVDRFAVTLSTEYFRFLEAETETPLVQVDQDGWRTGISASYSIAERWRFSGGYRLEYGPGASVDGFEASVTYAPTRALTVQAWGATLTRPLEFRLTQSEVRMLGLEAGWQAHNRVRVGIGGSHYYENRDRPDAAAFDWNQLRLHARLTLQLASDRDAGALPPAIRRRPPGGER